jgi:predicted ribosome quality control (RQC) complex YloA/Tae2 family protein
MLRNYFTLYHAAMELHEKLAGGILLEIQSQHKNELTLSFKTNDGNHLQLVVVTHTPQLSLYTKEGFLKKTKNSASLMSETHGQSVKGIEISASDRVIRIHLADNAIIVLQLFRSKTNVFLVRENRITDAFKHKSELCSKPCPTDDESPGLLRALETLALNKALFLQRFSRECSGSTPERLSLILEGFDRTLVTEVMKRANDENNPELLFAAFQSVFFELLDPMVQVTEKENGEPEFTLLHSQLQGGETFDSVLEGLSRYSMRMSQYLETGEELKAYRTKLQQQLGKTRRELKQYNPGLLEELARNYESSGHLLIASLYLERTEPESIRVKNIFDAENPDSEITIKLKPALTIQENAEEYFVKASKTRGKLKAMQARHSEIEKKRVELEELLAETATISTPKEARRFVDVHSRQVKKAGTSSSKSGSDSPFRSVQLSPSITLFIGKNAANNELLTFSHSKPNDIWLHARGSAGSHCLLKGASMHQLPEIRKAAAIAAWYSAAKHSELVPVMYTLKKYVRRGKNLAPGQVIVEREEVVMVRPSKGIE